MPNCFHSKMRYNLYSMIVSYKLWWLKQPLLLKLNQKTKVVQQTGMGIGIFVVKFIVIIVIICIAYWSNTHWKNTYSFDNQDLYCLVLLVLLTPCMAILCSNPENFIMNSLYVCKVFKHGKNVAGHNTIICIQWCQ